jgi:hypothetical protein
MDIETGVIYLAALAKPEKAEDDHYNTVEPPKIWPCDNKVCGKKLDPITHKDPGNPLTSHHNLANHVITECKMGDPTTAIDRFCGFSLRNDGNKCMSFSRTSRTLNPGGNGLLEEVLTSKIMAFLSPKLKLIGLGLSEVAQRITPDQAQAARGGAVAPSALFAQIRKIN